MNAANYFLLEGNIVNLMTRHIGYGQIHCRDGKIESITYTGPEDSSKPYLLPGFIDAHIHIESSMLTPPAFARMAVRHGSVATVSDPHEIANVCGLEGVRYMSRLGRESGFLFFFGAPSCVPATPFESAGAEVTASDIQQLFAEGICQYLSEMMNYPAVLRRDPLVMDKIAVAKAYDRVVDGHAPGLRGTEALAYATAGISTDHECTTLEEALDKIDAGMHIIIREGSAAKNFEALHALIGMHPDRVMFCSDDKHPDDLIQGHINQMVTRSLDLGYDLMDVLRIACLNPVLHYKLPVGRLQERDPVDLIMVKDLHSFKVVGTWIRGKAVYTDGVVRLPEMPIPVINSFGIGPVLAEDLELTLEAAPARIIVAVDGTIVTRHEDVDMSAENFQSDLERDLLKLVVINRYTKAPPAIALIKGFGLKSGAIAESVAHDSHNIIAVGTNDLDLADCINDVIRMKGGLCVLGRMAGIPRDLETPNLSRVGFENMAFKKLSLPLPVGGLMSDQMDGEVIGKLYGAIDSLTKHWLGSTLSAPFMTLSFMALLVIPTLKLSDKGLFDGTAFQFTPVQSPLQNP